MHAGKRCQREYEYVFLAGLVRMMIIEGKVPFSTVDALIFAIFQAVRTWKIVDKILADTKLNFWTKMKRIDRNYMGIVPSLIDIILE